MEEEARELLTAGLAQTPSVQPNLFEAIRKVVDPLGGIE
jgi:plasmid stability protein